MSALIDLTVRSRPDGAAETSALARLHLFDALAVASAGAGTLAGHQAIAQLRSGGAGPSESVPGTVLALARCIRSTELDDIQLESVTTAGAAVVPALIGGLLAAGEPRPAADAVLGAMATGYDVMYLAGLATGGPDFLYRKRGWPSLAAAGPAAAATAARVMGLGDDGAGHAMALALLSTPAGLRAGTEDGRWLSFGLAVAAGVEAALAARAGARGDLRAVENAARAGQGPFSCLQQIRTPSWQPGQGLARAQLKRWASAAQVAAAIDTAGALRDEEGIRPGELAAVDVYVPADYRQMIDQPARAGRVWSLLSAQYQVAVRLLHPGDLYDCGRVMLRGSAAFRALMSIISVHHGPDLEHLYPQQYPARVEVTLSDGRKLARLSAGRSPSPSWDWDTVMAKALKLCPEDTVRQLHLATAGADLDGDDLAGAVLACIDRMLGARSPVA